MALAIWRCVVIAAIGALLGACSLGYNQRAPEVLYSNTASETKSLQVPPDLTDVSDGEQFVLPGTTSEAVTRNTLLPQFQTARHVRHGQSSWLEIASAPETLWPELLAFLRRQDLVVLRTEPVNGLIETEWAPDVSDSGGSVLKNLLGTSDVSLYQRVLLRMERDSTSTRLFVRLQQADKAVALAEGANQLAWPVDNPEPEAATVLLQRLLVHLGISEQRAKGILGDFSAALILDSATLERTAGGTQLLLHRGYRQSFRSMLSSLSALGMQITGNDDGTGAISVIDLRQSAAQAYTFKLYPVHISAVKVAVVDALGRPLDPDLASRLLGEIRDQLV